MRRLALALAGCLLLAAPAARGQEPAAGKRVALVVAAPADGAAAKLAERSTARVAEALGKAGFTVLAKEPTRAGLLAGMAELKTAAATADLALAYFIGTTVAVGAETFLVPADTVLSDPADLVFGAVELDRLAGAVRDAGGRPAVLVLDPLPPKDPGAPAAALGMDARAGLASQAARPGVLVLSSVAPDTAPSMPRGTGPAPLAAVLAQVAGRPGATARDLATAAAKALPKGATGQPLVQDGLKADVTIAPAPPPQVAALPKPSPEPSPPPAEPPEVVPAAASLVTLRGANLRKLPEPKAELLRTLPQGTTVEQVGLVKGNDAWAAVRVDGLEGFLFRSSLGPPPGEAPARPVPRGQAPTLVAGAHMVKVAAHLFEQPVFGSRGLRDLPTGERVTVLESLPDGRWALVEAADGLRGYMGSTTLEPAPPEETGVAAAGPDAPAAPGPGGDKPDGQEPQVAMTTPLPQPPPRPSVAGEDIEGLPEPVTAAARAAQAAAERAGALAREAALAAEAAAAAQSKARAVAEQARARAAALGTTIRYGGPQTYAGEAKGQVREGLGVLAFGDGSRQEGEWAADAKVGHGVLVFSNGDTYEGSFKDGRRQGHGVMSFRAGGSYLGVVAADRNEPLGEYRFAGGDVYRGEIRDGVPAGLGELSYASGAVYRGRFVAGRPDGPGRLAFPDGRVHLGGFRTGQQGGPGIAYTATGQRRFGIWAGTQLVSGQAANN